MFVVLFQKPLFAMVKGSEIPSDKVSANILDPDPWANCNNVADVLGHDWETQLDVATVRHFESLSALENPKQLPSSCCYGRGKRLGDIVVPRLPNLLEEEQFAVTPLGIRDENVSLCCILSVLLDSFNISDLSIMVMTSNKTCVSVCHIIMYSSCCRI